MNGNKPHYEDIPADVRKENHLQVLRALSQLGQTLKDIRADALRHKSQNITLSTVDTPFYAEGFLYNSLYISDASAADNAKLIVTIGAISYTVTLIAGENETDIPDNCTIKVSTTSGNPVTALLTRYNTVR